MWSKKAGIQKKSSTTKFELMRLNGSINFDTSFFDNLHVKKNRLYDLLHDNGKLHWSRELKMSFQQNKTSVTKDVTLILDNSKHRFYFSVDSSSFDIGCVLFEMNIEVKRTNFQKILLFFKAMNRNFSLLTENSSDSYPEKRYRNILTLAIS